MKSKQVEKSINKRECEPGCGVFPKWINLNTWYYQCDNYVCLTHELSVEGKYIKDLFFKIPIKNEAKEAK